MLYLLVGEDESYKQSAIQSLKKKLLNPKTEAFNYELLYAGDVSLSSIKESLLGISANTDNRMIVIKDAFKLGPDLKECLSKNAENIGSNVHIIFDTVKLPQADGFFEKILKTAKVSYCKPPKKVNAFNLGTSISGRQAEYALNILADLLERGEKPEMILGALRYQLAKEAQGKDKAKKINMLLKTDLNIKTGKLKPRFALEELIIKLSRL